MSRHRVREDVVTSAYHVRPGDLVERMGWAEVEEVEVWRNDSGRLWVVLVPTDDSRERLGVASWLSPARSLLRVKRVKQSTESEAQ